MSFKVPSYPTHIPRFHGLSSGCSSLHGRLHGRDEEEDQARCKENLPGVAESILVVRGLFAAVASKEILLAQQLLPGPSGKAAECPATFIQASPKDLFPAKAFCSEEVFFSVVLQQPE